MHGAILLLAIPLALTGCGAIGVDSFAGSVIAMDLTWPLSTTVTVGTAKVTSPFLLQPGEHLDLWAVDASGHASRVVPERPDNAASPFPGFVINRVVDPGEPCMIDMLIDPQTSNARATVDPTSGDGYLLLSPSGQSGADPDLALQQVVDHVRQVLDLTVNITPAGKQGGAYPTGGATSDLLVLSEAYSGPQTPPNQSVTLTGLALDDPSTHTARKAACSAFIASLLKGCPSDGCRPSDTAYSYYIGNPRQFTAPLLGRLYGFFDFQTSPVTDPTLPQQNYGGITITTLADLTGTAALIISRETTAVPTAPAMPALIQGMRLPDADAGRGAARFALGFTIPQGAGMGQTVVVGTVSILSGLNQGISP